MARWASATTVASIARRSAATACSVAGTHHAERETERLSCRRPATGDGQLYRALLLDPQVDAWLHPSHRGPYTEADAADRLARDVRHWDEHGFGPWLLTDRTSGALVGRGGLSWTDAVGRRAVELPWAIVPERWGQGLATEAARAALVVAAELGLDEVVAYTRRDNAASIRVMEKLGLEYEGAIERAGLPHLVYRTAPATGSGRRFR